MTYLIIDELRLQNKDIDELTLLAEDGSVDAQYELGIKYLHVNKEQLNFPKAIRWLEEATVNGDVGAKETLASIYHVGNELGADASGNIIDADLPKAVKLYIEAAEENSILSKARLVVLADEGVFADPELIEQYKNDIGQHLVTHPKRKEMLLGVLIAIGIVVLTVVVLVRMLI